MTSPGLLRIVATPLGNLADLSPRARDALATADAIAAEDTRRTGALLARLGLAKRPLLSYFAPQEKAKAGAVLRRLREGATVALVTDGGTPGVSDPGGHLVARAHAEGIRVEPVPGPSAVALALSVSGEHSGGRFVFEGFPPSRGAARRKRYAELAAEARTVVLYEAPHRLPASLVDLRDVLGPDRRGTVVREATKLHEEIATGTLAELAERFAFGVKGEIVIVVEGSDTPLATEVRLPPEEALGLLVEAGLSPDRAARVLARATGLPRGKLTRLAREAGKDPSA